MRFDLGYASLALLAWLTALLFYDFVTFRGRARHMLAFEAVVFFCGAWFIAFPELATRLATLVGIGRGVDFLLYPTVIWLVRESLLARRLRYEQEQRLTELVRSVALQQAGEVGSE